MRSVTTIFKSFLVTIVAATLLTSCIKDKFDEPQQLPDEDPNLEVNFTIEQLKDLYKTEPVEITEDFIISGTVISDDQEGNVYQTLVIQDATGGVGFRIQRTDLFTDFPFGRKVYVNLKGLWVGSFSNLIQIGAGDNGEGSVTLIPAAFVDDFFVKGPRNQTVTPLEIAVEDLSSRYQNTLIKVKDLQFVASAAGKATYADAVRKFSVNLDLENCSGTKLVLRSSGYAKFAADVVPTGKGDVVGIFQIFGTTNQIVLNKVADLQFNNPERCGGGPIDPEPVDTTAPTEPGAGAQILFPGANFEDFNLFKSQLNSFGLQPYATQAVGLGKEGNALAIKGTPTGNDFVFTIVPSGNAKFPDGITKLSFYVKGTSAKSLSLNVYGNGAFTAFNVGNLTKNTLLKSSANNQYTGTIDTKGEWVLVTLDLTGVATTNPTDRIFALKVGSNSVYDLLIDNIVVW